METFSAVLAICAGNSPVHGEFPAQRPVTRSFDVFVDLRLNKRFSRQPWGWWFESLSRPLWRHRNGILRPWSFLIPLLYVFSGALFTGSYGLFTTRMRARNTSAIYVFWRENVATASIVFHNSKTSQLSWRVRILPGLWLFIHVQ